MNPETEQFVKKFPMNKRGFHVLPCTRLTRDTMESWMTGMRVSVGLVSDIVSAQGTIAGWDDSSIILDMGGKKKKFPYDPNDIQLCVYQFDIGVMFNGVVRTDGRSLGVPPSVDESPVVQPKEIIEESACVEEEKEVVLPREQETTSCSLERTTVSSYKPKHNIVRF